MTTKLIHVDLNPSPRQLKVFGIIWLIFFLFLGAIFIKNHAPWWPSILIWLFAVLVPFIGWFIPAFLRVVYVGMNYVAFPIGFIVSSMILVFVYYLVLTPIGLIGRLFGYDPMSRHFDEHAETYWRTHEMENNINRYLKQF